MKYFTSAEILLSVLYSIALGAFLGVLRRVYLALVQNTRLLLALPGTALRISGAPSAKAIKTAHTSLAAGKIPRALFEVLEFFYFFFAGICYILLSYLALDLSIRLYTLVLVAISAVLVNQLFKKTLDRVIFYLMNRLAYALLCIFTFIFVPMRKIFLSVYRRVLLPLARRLDRIFCRIRTEYFIRRGQRLERECFFKGKKDFFALNRQRKTKRLVQLSQKRKGCPL